MNMKKLLTGAALLTLGVTGGAMFHGALDRQAHAQGENTAQPVQQEGAKGAQQGADQGAKQAEGASGTNSAEPELGTRGESGRAGPMRAPDAGAKATEPDKGDTEPAGSKPPKSSQAEKPHSNKFQQNKSGGDRDPIPPGTETASPTQRQSRPW
jgi:hypothetical protein